MKTTGVVVARIMLGLLFFVFGLNGFVEFLPEPEMKPEGEAFIGALIDSGYLMTLVKVVEVVCGALLLAGYFIPLALVLLAPNIVNIAAFHLFLEPSGSALGMVAVILALHLFLTSQHWSVYRPMLAARPSPAEEGQSGLP